jgi:hypothetical protein
MQSISSLLPRSEIVGQLEVYGSHPLTWVIKEFVFINATGFVY